MTEDTKLPSGRLGRLARLAAMGARTGAGMLLDRDGGGASAAQAAEVLGNLRGLAAKVGQMASYVDGMIPDAHQASYESALKTLQSQAPRSSSAEVRTCVEQELAAPLDRLFATWDDAPIASASIGQVHRATLHDGTEVAVKVQHPGIEKAIESDLKNAGMIEGLVSVIGGRRIDAKAMLNVVRTRFREELDYQLEAARLSHFAAVHQGDAHVIVPEVFASHSKRRVLTTAFMRGQTFEAAVAASEADRTRWAQTMWRFVFKGALRGGLLAADPHPGNYIFQSDGRVVFLDYGCIQPLAPEHRQNAEDMHRAALARSEAGFGEAVKRLVGSKPGQLEPLALRYTRRCFEPLFEAPYRITRDYAAALLSEMKEMGRASLKVKAEEFFTMPPHMLFVNRLQFGFYSVLARLDAEVDYAAVERGFLC